MNENYEVMEQETMEPAEVCEGTMEETTESRGGFGAAALAVGVLTLGGLGIAKLVKKLKTKKADEPKKPKTKLKLVRVPVDENGEELAEITDENEVVENNEN